MQQCENQLKDSLILTLRAGRAANGGVYGCHGQAEIQKSPGFRPANQSASEWPKH